MAQPEFRPRALFERFGIVFLATTDGALDPLEAPRGPPIGLDGSVVPTFRPDDVVDPQRPGFHANVATLGDLTGHDTCSWSGYLDALPSAAPYSAAGATAVRPWTSLTRHGGPLAP